MPDVGDECLAINDHGLRLLNFDSRWRKDPHWEFFNDRILKQRILYANRMRKTNPQNAKHLTAGDVTGMYCNSIKKCKPI